MFHDLDYFIHNFTERVNGAYICNKDLYTLYTIHRQNNNLPIISPKRLTMELHKLWSDWEPTYIDDTGHIKTKYCKPIIRSHHAGNRIWRNIQLQPHAKRLLVTLNLI